MGSSWGLGCKDWDWKRSWLEAGKSDFSVKPHRIGSEGISREWGDGLWGLLLGVI